MNEWIKTISSCIFYSTRTFSVTTVLHFFIHTFNLQRIKREPEWKILLKSCYNNYFTSWYISCSLLMFFFFFIIKWVSYRYCIHKQHHTPQINTNLLTPPLTDSHTLKTFSKYEWKKDWRGYNNNAILLVTTESIKQSQETIYQERMYYFFKSGKKCTCYLYYTTHILEVSTSVCKTVSNFSICEWINTINSLSWSALLHLLKNYEWR